MITIDDKVLTKQIRSETLCDRYNGKKFSFNPALIQHSAAFSVREAYAIDKSFPGTPAIAN